MNQRIYSLETEYALTHSVSGNGAALTAKQLFPLLSEKLPRTIVAPGSSPTLLFLKNGGKFYDDNGHPEWSCPECRNPRDAVIWDAAGQCMLSELADKVEQSVGGKILIAKNNIDSRGNAYGCHENYLIERRPPLYPSESDFFKVVVRQLAPFLVTRQVLSGAGRLGPLTHAKSAAYGFQISQRAEAMHTIVSQETRKDRAIINSKDEALCDRTKYRRLHLIIGDSNMSEWATYLKLGTTGLILWMIEEGFIDHDLSLENPLFAVREISYDPTCRRPLQLRDGRRLTAVDIQQCYVDMAHEFLRDMPHDQHTQTVVAEWENALQDLKTDPYRLTGKADWVTKKMLMERQMESESMDWNDPRVREIDIRYHDIHPHRGLFQQIKAQKMTTPLGDSNEIAHAREHPPLDTRARIRSEAICAAIRWDLPLRVEWDRVELEHQLIVMDDPFQFFDKRIKSKLCDGQELTDLGTMLEHYDPMIRRRVISALSDLEGVGAVELLMAATGDSDPMVRIAAVEALSTKQSENIDALLHTVLTDDPHFAVKHHAAAAIGRLGILSTKRA